MKIRTLLYLFLAGGMISCGPAPEDISELPGPEYRLVRLHYENSEGERGITHYYYDLQDQNYLAIWHLDDSSRSSVNTHTLDSAGQLLEKSREFSDGISSLQRYVYDEKGKLIREGFERSDGLNGEVDYTYNQDGQLMEADCRGLNGWFHGTIKYTWKEGIKTGAKLFRENEKIGSIVYGYEGERLVTEIWDFAGDWSQEFRFEYQKAAPQSYTSPNVFIRESPWFRVAAEEYDFNGESGGPSYYTYDMDGKLSRKEFARSDGLYTTTTYDYDSLGLLDHSLREYGDGQTADFLYWYSVDRLLLVKTFQWSEGLSGSETYRYQDGFLTEGEYVNMDKWLNGTFQYSYDENGILRSAEFSGKDCPGARLGFFYDLDFNLKKIHWEFSSGHTQDYYFLYEPAGSVSNQEYGF